jgi:hypothetical protein
LHGPPSHIDPPLLPLLPEPEEPELPPELEPVPELDPEPELEPPSSPFGPPDPGCDPQATGTPAPRRTTRTSHLVEDGRQRMRRASATRVPRELSR